MKTQYLTTSDEDLKIAAEIIKSGGLVAFPTETVYGLGGNALSAFASKAIYEAKGRPSDNPLIVHISCTEEVDDIAMRFPDNARKLAEALWPGPMTLVLPKFDVVPDATTGGLDTVAIRCPLNETARKLIKYAGVPIAAPSANTSGRPSPTKWEHVKHDLDGKIDAIIMGEPCIGGIESTVIDMTEELPMILRPGLITPEIVTKILGLPCDYDPAIKEGPSDSEGKLVPRAPGMKYKHYAPKAQMNLYSGSFENVKKAINEEAEKLKQEGANVVTIIYEDAETAARNLFADLRNADDGGADIILASALPSGESLNYSVMNRMLKSAGYNVIEV
ncbi:MAG: L-threonylcarbamoyladenylate synthase [Bacillota bacterium]|nr:L-threonylcarbamoyladenylate synthase [Bacillota bacterium]